MARLRSWRVLSVALFLGVFLIAASPALAATNYVVNSRQSATVFLPGAFACLYDPASDKVIYDPEALEYGYQSSSFPVLLDTGASGIMLSKSVSESLKIGTTGEKYSDYGITGTEEFNVSKPVGLRLAVASSSIYSFEMGDMLNIDWNHLEDLSSWIDSAVDNTENQTFYKSYGTFTTQVRKEDSQYAGMEVAYNVVGTPVLNKYVMHVKPNVYSYSTLIPTIAYLETELLSGMPTDLPSTGAVHIPLTYKNFVTSETSVTTGDNPLVPGVHVTYGGKSTTPSEWLFDTGASVTMMGTDLATEIGIPWQSEDPASVILVSGVGKDSTEITLSGYKVDCLIIPTADGGELTFANVIVYISTDGALPANLTGILGMNLFSQSIDYNDEFSIYYPTASAFSDWYIDHNGGELVLVMAVPEPSSFVLLAVGLSFFLLRRTIRRRRA